jgi:ABC-2 type transport system ATP-binding protein
VAEPPLVVPCATVTRTDGPRQWLRFRRSETTAAQVVADVAATARLRDLTIEEPAIEDIVREIYERGIRGPRAAGEGQGTEGIRAS